jgi:hypothetical protein
MIIKIPLGSLNLLSHNLLIDNILIQKLIENSIQHSILDTKGNRYNQIAHDDLEIDLLLHVITAFSLLFGLIFLFDIIQIQWPLIILGIRFRVNRFLSGLKFGQKVLYTRIVISILIFHINIQLLKMPVIFLLLIIAYLLQ